MLRHCQDINIFFYLKLLYSGVAQHILVNHFLEYRAKGNLFMNKFIDGQLQSAQFIPSNHISLALPVPTSDISYKKWAFSFIRKTTGEFSFIPKLQTFAHSQSITLKSLRSPYPVNKAYQFPLIKCCFIAICVCIKLS